MKAPGKRLGFAVLAVAYLVSALVVLRHGRKAEDPGRVTIRIAQWQLEVGVREAIDAVIHRYEQLNPRVRVVQIAVPGGPTYISWILTRMAGGNGPDLAQYDGTFPDIGRIFQPIGADVREPNPYNRGTPLAGVPWRDTFLDGMVSNYNRLLNDYYAVSLDVHVSRIVYNRPLLKAVTGSDAPPRTYRELLAVSAQIRAYARAHGLDLTPMANSPDATKMQAWLMAMAMTTGMCERIDYQHRLSIGLPDLGEAYLRNDWSYDTPEAVAWLNEMKEYGALCTPGFWQRSRTSAVSDFVSGHAVMIVAPSWAATELLALCPFSIAAFTYPYPREDDPVYGRYAHGPFSEGQIALGLPIYLNRATPHRAEAVDFLKFMTSQEGSAIFTRISNWPPATIGVKPSAFAAQFKFHSEGYCWGGNLMVPTQESDAQNFVFTHLAELWGSNGSVDAFRAVLRAGMRGKISDDFRKEISSELDNLRRIDVAAVAQVELAPPARRPEVLPILAASNEGVIYQLRALVEPAGAAAAPPLEIRGAGPGAAAAGAVPSDPRLAEAWGDLAAYRAREAAGIFDRRRSAAEPAVARGAVLGEAAALLDRQPVSTQQLDQARGLLAGLAAGADDIASAAIFLLGRIAQHHLYRPDATEAAREYARLIRRDPHSLWAQTALARLALLEIYALDLASPPAERVERAETLLAQADTPAAVSDLHLVIAYAILNYRLPAGGALPHLLAAERQGRLNWTDRTEVLVQIAELSRLAGAKEQAARYYRAFLAENPIDLRRYIVRQRLAALSAVPPAIVTAR